MKRKVSKYLLKQVPFKPKYDDIKDNINIEQYKKEKAFIKNRKISIKLIASLSLAVLVITLFFVFVFPFEGQKMNDINNQVDYLSEEESAELNQLMFGKDYTMGEIPSLASLIELYYFSQHSDYLDEIYEALPTDNDYFVGGYVSQDTLDIIDKIKSESPLMHPVDYEFHVNGINNYFNDYRILVIDKKINLKEHPIKYIVSKSNEFPIKLGSDRLVVVQRQTLYTMENLNDKTVHKTNIYSNISGKIENNNYVIEQANNSPNKYLIMENPDDLEQFYIADKIGYYGVNIEEYNGNKCIYEDCSWILSVLNSIYNGPEEKIIYENYITKIQECIISENKELLNGNTFVYDYEKIKTIFIKD